MRKLPLDGVKEDRCKDSRSAGGDRAGVDVWETSMGPRAEMIARSPTQIVESTMALHEKPICSQIEVAWPIHSQ